MQAMASDTVAQIKARLSIMDVVSQFVKLERAGSTMKARCPFHAEKTPSFIVSPDRGTYHCFGCGVGGDIFSFTEAIEGVDFKGALKILAERAGVPLVYEKSENKDERDRLREAMEAATIFYTNKMNEEVQAYLEKRGIKESTIKAFRIGFAPGGWHELAEYLKEKRFSEKELLDAGLGKKNEKGVYDRFRSRIIFPMSDSAGRVVAFSGRIFGTALQGDSEAPKYINSPETLLYKKSEVLYGFDRAKQAIRKHNFAVLVEGQMDLVATHQAGFTNAIAVSGTAFTGEHATLIKRMTDNLLIALDADEAGVKAAARAARAALAAGLHVKIAQLPTGVDPADLLQKEGEEAWKKTIREAKDIITFLLDTLEERLPQKDRFRRHVEFAVLPFLMDVQSPIERDAYLREIASRLGVSETAVADALAKLKSNEPRALARPEERTPVAPAMIGRAKQSLGILLWQERLATPAIDVAAYRKGLEKALGKELLGKIAMVSASEAEALMFGAESLHGGSGNLRRDTESLLTVLERERLMGELAEATKELREAEAAGREPEMAACMERCKLLTEAIAHLGPTM